MNTYLLIAILFVYWWIIAPIGELRSSMWDKAKRGIPREEIHSTGVTLIPYWILSIGFFGIAKVIDVFAAPWGSWSVAVFILIVMLVSLLGIVINTLRLRKHNQSELS